MGRGVAALPPPAGRQGARPTAGRHRDPRDQPGRRPAALAGGAGRRLSRPQARVPDAIRSGSRMLCCPDRNRVGGSMLRIALSALAASLLALGLDIPAAHAQQRAFVAAQGSDANPCTFAQPCRTFQHAHDVLASGGEIDVLDPAGYGPLNITKGISIQGHGFAGISTSPNGRAIEINATATDAVSLNGLLVEGNGVGQYGIIFTTANSLVVDNCVVRNFTAHGLLAVSNAVSATQWLGVSNSILDNNLYGIMLG